MPSFDKKTKPTVDDFAVAFPGFPEFVHYIMMYINDGKTPEEAADAVNHLVNEGIVAAEIDDVERTHASFQKMASGGYEVSMPQLLDYDDVVKDETDAGSRPELSDGTGESEASA